MALAISPQVPSHPHPLRATLSLCVSLEGCRHARSPYTLYICDVSYREGWVCLATDGAHTSPASTPVPSSDGLGKRIPRSGKHPFPMICSHYTPPCKIPVVYTYAGSYRKGACVQWGTPAVVSEGLKSSSSELQGGAPEAAHRKSPGKSPARGHRRSGSDGRVDGGAEGEGPSRTSLHAFV